ncbi:Dymeclin-like [Oopsacas minuta]|uniref:Dymeclin n=1 Tax=Oopsacas minuta TaxID=111878 RepID=A0AAV7JLD8_9METZ|nr:Dymeclin-like [Oopsacas minuta]
MSTSYVSLRENSLLKVLVGNIAISEGESFWNELLNFSFSPPATISDSRLLTDVLQESLCLFMQNDTHTKHFLRITNCFLQRAPSLADDVMSRNEIYMQKTLNALFLTRIFLQFFIQNQSHAEVIKHFTSTILQSKPSHNRSKSDTCRKTINSEPAFSLPHLSPVIAIRHTSHVKAQTSIYSSDESLHVKYTETLYEKLIQSLFIIITEVEIKPITMSIHLEALRFSLVILGTQLFSNDLKSDKDMFIKTFLSLKNSIIIEVVIHLLENITRFSNNTNVIQNEPNSYLSFLPGYSWIFGGNAEDNTSEIARPIPNTEELISKLSTHLLLVLILQNPLSNCTVNSYRKIFSNFKDFSDSPSVSNPGLVTSYQRLYISICGYLHQEEAVLLLYQTLLRHSAMKSFIWSKTEFSPLLLPLLETLYSAESTSLHHIYMISIIILMLSQDTGFCSCIHTQIISHIPWYKEKKLVNISLGSLLVLSLLHLLITNITHLKDQYIHTNCSAILANIASKIQNIHNIPSQKLINVFEAIAKKYLYSKNSDGISLLEGILRIILALINSILANNFTLNTQLVYTLIYRKEVFSNFRTHPEFCMLTQNIFSVVDFFESQLKIHAVFNTSEEGLEILGDLSRKWPADGLRRFPEQKYKYCEEQEPDEFFIPYIWTLIYRNSGLYWQHSKIKLMVN